MSKIEAIVLNEEDAKITEAYGANRLELVSAINAGGLTPSYGTIKQVVKSVQIPIFQKNIKVQRNLPDIDDEVEEVGK